MNKEIYIVESFALGKKWVVRARDVEDATGKVVSYARAEISARVNAASPGDDVDLDIRVRVFESNVVEI